MKRRTQPFKLLPGQMGFFFAHSLLKIAVKDPLNETVLKTNGAKAFKKKTAQLWTLGPKLATSFHDMALKNLCYFFWIGTFLSSAYRKNTKDVQELIISKTFLKD